MTRYNSSYQDCLPFSDTGIQVNLAANSEKHFTVPGVIGQTYRAEFSYNLTSNVWVGYNVTAAVPTSNTIAATYNLEFKPGQCGDARFVSGGDVLSFITSDSGGAQVGVSLLSLPTPP